MRQLRRIAESAACVESGHYAGDAARELSPLARAITLAALLLPGESGHLSRRDERTPGPHEKTSSQRDECGHCCFELARRLQHSWLLAVDVDLTLLLLAETESDETLSARPPTGRSAAAAAPSRLSPSEDRDRTADPAAGRCNERHPPRVPPLRRSLARSASVRRPARAGQRLPPASRHPLERQTTLFVPYRRDGRLRGRCRLTLAARGQPPFVNSPVSVIVIKHLLAEPRRRGGVRMVQVLHP